MPHHIVTRIFESYHDTFYIILSSSRSITNCNRDTHLEGVPADSTNISSKSAFLRKLDEVFWGGNSPTQKTWCFEGCQAIKSHLLSHNFLRQTRENGTWNCPKTKKKIKQQLTTHHSSPRFSQVINFTPHHVSTCCFFPNYFFVCTVDWFIRKKHLRAFLTGPLGKPFYNYRSCDTN